MKEKLRIRKTVVYMSKHAVFAILLLSCLFVTGQTKKKADWRSFNTKEVTNFYDVKKNFYEFWRGRTIVKGKGYKPFKRWEAFMEPRVYPSGDMRLPSTTYPNFIAWKQTNASQTGLNTGGAASKKPNSGESNWTELGPIGSPTGPSPYSRTGAGRINFVRVDPTNDKVMYVGAPDGGLWKSKNSGKSWTTNTDFLSIIGCSDLVIHPTNSKLMYLATGDLENDRRSIGILKSTNGGDTWSPTGLVWTAPDNYKISRLLMDPTNPLKMIISTNRGTFSTTDGWATFTQGNFGSDVPDLKDMELKPGAPATVYAAGKTFWKSTNFGSTWTNITTGLPAEDDVSRIALGVSPGNNAYVYALIGKSADQGLLGLYRSNNSGTSFSLRSSTPNLLGYETDGSDAGGQAFYDLAITVSPTNAEIVTTGGINHWQSTNGGVTWTNYSYWASGEVHADIHELTYMPGSNTTMFSCNDGGFFKSTDNGSTWVDFSNNLAIAQVVGLGVSANDPKKIVAGEQDNGTNLKKGNNWDNIYGGDGGECFFDYTNDNTIYIQYVSGDFRRSDDGGATNISIATGLPSGIDFYSQWGIDPVNPSKLYVGGTPTLYTSDNKGDNWFALGTPPGSGTIKDFAVAPSNTSIIYAIKFDAISKSTNSGASFTDVTGTLPVANASLSSVTISNTDPNKVWITFSGYSAGDKVYKTIDGGATWINISTGLPNLPMNTTVYENNTVNDAVYLGGDIGVYYIDNSLTSFIPYMTNLPNSAVRDLEIYYPTGKLRAGTYGRGVWETDLNDVETFTITATAGRNGTISPDGKVDVIKGGNQTFSITPDAGYVVEDVTVDGKTSVGAVSTYTFTNVTEKHTIKASFTEAIARLASKVSFKTATNTLHVVGTGGKAPYTYSTDGTNYHQNNMSDGGHDFAATGSTYKIFVKDRSDHVYATSGSINSLSSIAPTGVAGQNSTKPATTISTIISPNPSEHEFTLRVTSSSSQPIRVRVLDMNQRVMYTSQGAVKVAYRFGENFRPGTYVVEITQGNDRRALKVIKK